MRSEIVSSIGVGYRFPFVIGFSWTALVISDGYLFFMNAHSLHFFWLRKSNYNQIRFLDIVILLDDSYIHVMFIW